GASATTFTLVCVTASVTWAFTLSTMFVSHQARVRSFPGSQANQPFIGQSDRTLQFPACSDASAGNL
ncbi:MAG: hypothetical protein ABJJ37_02360, partial [Roseibium sp.]